MVYDPVSSAFMEHTSMMVFAAIWQGLQLRFVIRDREISTLDRPIVVVVDYYMLHGLAGPAHYQVVTVFRVENLPIFEDVMIPQFSPITINCH